MVTFASTIQNAVDNEVRRRLHQQHCIRENQAAEVFQETLSEIYAWLTDDPPRFVFHCDDTYRGITEVYDLADKSKKPLPFGVVHNSNLDGRLVELLTLPDLLTAHFRKRAWRIANRIIHREKGQYYLPQTKKRRALQLPPDEVWSMEQATLSGDDEIVPARVNRHLEESIAKKSEESLYDLREIVRKACKTGRDRLIVRRREDGLTLEEIAHELGVNKSTVKRALDRIAERVKHHLRKGD